MLLWEVITTAFCDLGPEGEEKEKRDYLAIYAPPLGLYPYLTMLKEQTVRD